MKRERNPKEREIAKAKAEVFKFWQERHQGKHPGLRTEDQFAIEACRKWPILESIGTIKKWSTNWRNEFKVRQKARELWREAYALGAPLLPKASGLALEAARRWPDLASAHFTHFEIWGRRFNRAELKRRKVEK